MNYQLIWDSLNNLAYQNPEMSQWDGGWTKTRTVSYTTSQTTSAPTYATICVY